MTDTQSPTTESQTTIDDARARSRRSFIAVLKANRDVFSNLPERIEQWLEKETRATNQPETTKHGRDESERLARSDMQKQLECFQAEINANTQSLVTLDQTVREMTAELEAMKSVHSSMVFSRDRYVERELKEKEDTIEANKEQLKLVEEENLKLKEELKKKEKEAKDKITKQEERIASLEGEQEKKERQIVEITREEKEKTEGLINEHQKEVDKLLREIQTIKEKLLKKSDYIQKMYEDYNKNLADHKSRTEGLTNEHQKEVDKLLREIQAMKEKNDTLLKEKEVEITNYTQMNLKLKEELKKVEKVAKEREERYQDDANYYKSKYKDLKAKSRTTDKELMARQERIAALERKLDSKQEEYDKEREQNRQKFAEKEKIAAELDKELASQEDFFKERKQRLEKELAESEKTIAELERKLDSKQEEYDKEREQNRQKFAEKENIIAELQRKLDSKQEEYDKEREQNRQKFSEKEKIVAELDKELASQEDVFKEQKQRREKELAESKKTLHLEKLERERARQHHVDELRDKETKMRALEARNEELTRQLEEHRIRSENLSADVEKTNLELRHYIERFQRQEETYKSDLSKETELRETKERLASLCEKRVNQDQRSVENVLASNRPSDVERDFKEFFDSNREDARDVIQSVYGSEKKEDVQIYYPRIVCTILVAAYEVTKTVKEAVLDLFKESTKKLVQQAPEVGRNFHLSRMDNNFVFYPISIDVCETSEKSTDVIDALLNSLKESAHICDLECLEKDVCEYAWKIWNEWYEETSSFTLAPSQKVLTELIRSGYIEACLRLAWRMVTQRPPLRLEYNSSIFDHHIHKKANGDTSLEEITCYLWPCLFDGGAKLICPGLVLCKM